MQRSLTPDFILQVLVQNGSTEFSADYRRLMEIYCVVKIGGTLTQIAAAQRLEATERAALLAEIAAVPTQASTESRVAALRQEIQEVERSVAHRIAYLQSIDPQEERNVHSCLSLIDAHFANLGTSPA
ncbi:MAG: hypothetical protein F6K00_32450 [Leptolyngbya sp. SIOISBB]|nr:hypothetical protein [Leptolyngbya sp. SIOISBB]